MITPSLPPHQWHVSPSLLQGTYSEYLRTAWEEGHPVERTLSLKQLEEAVEMLSLRLTPEEAFEFGEIFSYIMRDKERYSKGLNSKGAPCP